MNPTRYIVIKQGGRFWGIDVVMVEGVLDEPEIFKLPFVSDRINGIIVKDNNAIPVLTLGKNGGDGGYVVVIDSPWGRLGVTAEGVVSIMALESHTEERSEHEDEGAGFVLGSFSGEKVLQPDFKKIIDRLYSSV